MSLGEFVEPHGSIPVPRSAAGDGVHVRVGDEVPPRMARSVLLFPVVGILLLGLVYVVSRPAYYSILREDHPVEWFQFAVCLFTAVAAAATLRHGWGRDRRLSVLLLLVVLGTVFLAAEEISWGQRALGLATPTELAALNAQEELNLHNVKVQGDFGIHDMFKAFSVALGLTGATWALVHARFPGRSRGELFALLAPPTWTVPGSIGMVLYWPVALALPALANPVAAMQEWVEACLFVSLAATVVCIHARVRRRELAGSADPRLPSDPPRPTRVLLHAAVVILLLTCLLAGLTEHHGIVPGNVPVP